VVSWVLDTGVEKMFWLIDGSKVQD
jgi:hypothetical protein